MTKYKLSIDFFMIFKGKKLGKRFPSFFERWKQSQFIKSLLENWQKRLYCSNNNVLGYMLYKMHLPDYSCTILTCATQYMSWHIAKEVVVLCWIFNKIKRCSPLANIYLTNFVFIFQLLKNNVNLYVVFQRDTGIIVYLYF